MAYEIPSDFVLATGRLLVQADEGEGNPCVGTIIRIGEDINGCGFPRAFQFSTPDYTKIKRQVDDPDYIPDPEKPDNRPDQIDIYYTRIVFNRKTAQEVKLGDEDYFLIHVTDILGLIPPE
jgi:hypothetical protein